MLPSRVAARSTRRLGVRDASISGRLIRQASAARRRCTAHRRPAERRCCAAVDRPGDHPAAGLVNPIDERSIDQTATAATRRARRCAAWRRRRRSGGLSNRMPRGISGAISRIRSTASWSNECTAHRVVEAAMTAATSLLDVRALDLDVRRRGRRGMIASTSTSVGIPIPGASSTWPISAHSSSAIARPRSRPEWPPSSGSWWTTTTPSRGDVDVQLDRVRATLEGPRESGEGVFRKFPLCTAMSNAFHDRCSQGGSSVYIVAARGHFEHTLRLAADVGKSPGVGP